MDHYNIRVINLDSYMCSPIQGLDVMYSEFRGSAITQVPVLRLFGSTGTGHKICLHIHGVFPYFYIPYDGTEEVNGLMYRIAANIDKAVNISFNQASSTTQYVYKVSLVSGIPMYGYHSRKHQFLKIYLYNPLLIRRVSNLLTNDTTLGRLYQPHETHVPFTLQFMIDYNLHGMSNLILSEIKFRMNINEVNADISSEMILPATIKKVSVCELEGDALADHILNRLEVASGNIGVNPGIAALWADEIQRRRNKGEESQIEHFLELKNINVETTASHLIFKQALLDRLRIISSEMDIDVDEINLSVYPAETPENLSIQNASLVESEYPSSLELSLNSTLTPLNINDTTVSEPELLSNSNETLDEQAQELLNILQSLEANANEDIEEDSILSQVVKEFEEDKEFDLSMPLESVTTPKKIIADREDSDDEDDLFNTTLIPQLDGECDDEDEGNSKQLVINNSRNYITRSYTKLLNKNHVKNQSLNEQRSMKKALYVLLVRRDKYITKGRDMPPLDDDLYFMNNSHASTFSTCNNSKRNVSAKNLEMDTLNVNPLMKIDERKCTTEENAFKTLRSRKYKCRNYKKIRKIVTVKTKLQLKSWQFQIKRLKIRQQIIRTMKMLQKKEHNICILLSNNCNPIFKVIPGDNTRKFLLARIRKLEREAKIDILSHIMLKIKNYIDPHLHFILQCPSKKTFLFKYNTNMYPEVTEISKKLKIFDMEKLLKEFLTYKSLKKCDVNNNQNNVIHEYGNKVIKQMSQIKDCSTLNEDKFDKTIEFLSNNIATFSNCLDNDLQQNYSSKFNENAKNTQLMQIHFPREVIDSDNQKYCFIFSSKYLSNVSDDKLICDIKNQSVNQIKDTLQHVKVQLMKHVSCLHTPIGKKNICNKDLKVRSKDFNESSEQSENCMIEKHVQHENVLENRRDIRKKDCNIDSKDDKLNEMSPTPELNYVKDLRNLSQNCSSSKNNLSLKYITGDTCSDSSQTSEWNANSNINEDTFEIDSKPSISTNYLSLDGTRDSSSSSEDESSSLKRKKIYKKDSFFRYSALPVTVGTSPNQRSQDVAVKHPVSQNTIKNFEEEKTTINKLNFKQIDCDINVKRKLNFSSTLPLQTTIVEEKLVCNYSPFKKQEKVFHKKDLDVSTKTQHHPILARCVDTCVTEDGSIASVQNNYNIKCKSISDTAPIVIKCFDPDTDNKNQNSNDNSNNESDNADVSNFQQDYILNSTHCDIFSNSDSEDEFGAPSIITVTNKVNLMSTAQKYDTETNYNAKEGTSKVFTPLSSISSQKSTEQVSHSSGSSRSGSSSFGLLTPYQHEIEDNTATLVTIIEEEMENQNISATDDNDKTSLFRTNSLKSVINVTNCDTLRLQVLIPVKKAPSKDEICKSLDKYEIPSVKQDVPFYSNIEDVTGGVEVGYNVLKITSDRSVHLAEFDSHSDAINNFRKQKLRNMSSSLEWKRSNINNLALSFCKDLDCIIMPLKKPPSVTTVKTWMKEKSKKVVTPEKKIKKVKIFVPLSPGNNGDYDDDEINVSITLSPYTPSISQCSSGQTVVGDQTPKSSKSDESSLENEHKKIKIGSKHKLSQPLRKSLFTSQDKSKINNSCQITGVSPNNTYGFERSIENLQTARTVLEHQHLTLMVMELHIQTRGEFKPNPEYDSIRAIFYSVLNDVPADHPKASKTKGVIAINSLPVSPGVSKVPILDGIGVDCNITYVDSEENLLNEFLKLVDYWDPDIFAGYEIQMLSWSYLIERASVLGHNFKTLLSRTKEMKKNKDEEAQNELQIIGRIILDVWRLMRHEIALQSYTFESVVYHILHKRVPQYSFKDLSFWWDHRSTLYRHHTVRYYLFRVEMILELFDKLDIIGRTSELARLFGIQFYEVLSRGSQFRVESMMLRLAKPLNFIPVSPSVQQRSKMKAPEYIPLVLEPESKMYNDPVIVLDFQSLYPSIIIAYNYCFTTCLGQVQCLGKASPFDFGTCQLKVSRKRLERYLKKDLLNFSPCGIGFVKKEIRDGILPRMLREILDTRLMVKNSMKENRDNQLLQKVLHNRQLGLKLIANVTYGYTAANFSGRMPSVEVADSVVSKGRETLQRAIEMVDNTAEWGARVVYGDTDSLFVMVPGKSRQHAFEIGKKIADAVTKANPDPVKLKLEKVYQPCILQTKKRYVGYMYESPDQKQPTYDAKGIETVRRDGCPAVSKMLEKCLRLLFETKDVSLIKKYVLRQFNKIIAGRASIQDLTFAKEYRGKSGYRPGACVPSLELARRWTAVDKRNEPRRGERVPYIIVNGPPGLPLIRLARSPRDLLNDPSLRPNALYYITKVIIPPINRCFNLIGADLNTWFNQMPRKQIQTLPNSVSPGKKSTISQYFSTSSCVACGEQTQTGICNVCTNKPDITTITLMEKLRDWERNNYNCNLICQSCTSTQTEIKCASLDCPVLYRRIQTNRDLQQSTYIRELMNMQEFLF